MITRCRFDDYAYWSTPQLHRHRYHGGSSPPYTETWTITGVMDSRREGHDDEILLWSLSHRDEPIRPEVVRVLDEIFDIFERSLRYKKLQGALK